MSKKQKKRTRKKEEIKWAKEKVEERKDNGNKEGSKRSGRFGMMMKRQQD